MKPMQCQRCKSETCSCKNKSSKPWLSENASALQQIHSSELTTADILEREVKNKKVLRLLSLERLHNRVVLATACNVTMSNDSQIRIVREYGIAGKGALVFKAGKQAAKVMIWTYPIPDIQPAHRRQRCLCIARERTPVLPYAPGDIESVVENERCRIYWNYSFPTLELAQANKPDQQQKTMFVIEISAPAKVNVSS
nr:unnamed protein product [Callosobruchus analis]